VFVLLVCVLRQVSGVHRRALLPCTDVLLIFILCVMTRVRCPCVCCPCMCCLFVCVLSSCVFPLSMIRGLYSVRVNEVGMGVAVRSAPRSAVGHSRSVACSVGVEGSGGGKRLAGPVETGVTARQIDHSVAMVASQWSICRGGAVCCEMSVCGHSGHSLLSFSLVSCVDAQVDWIPSSGCMGCVCVVCRPVVVVTIGLGGCG